MFVNVYCIHLFLTKISPEKYEKKKNENMNVLCHVVENFGAISIQYLLHFNDKVDWIHYGLKSRKILTKCFMEF